MQCTATLQCRKLCVGTAIRNLPEKTTKVLGTHPDSRDSARADCRPQGTSASSSPSPALSPSWPMSSSSPMTEDELSKNLEECCPTQKFSTREVTQYKHESHRCGEKVTPVGRVHWKRSRVHYPQTVYNQRMGVIKVPGFSSDSSVENTVPPTYLWRSSPVT